MREPDTVQPFALPGVLLLAAVVASCSGDVPREVDDRRAPGRDQQTPTWTLADVPEFSVAEGTGESAFQVYRALHGLILHDGVTVVGNAGSGHLIYLDPTGRALRMAGGPGQGPSEFGRISGLFSAGDAVGAWDNQNGRVSYFSLRGEYLDAASFEPGAPLAPRGFLPDEGIVTSTAAWAPSGTAGEARRYQVWNEQGQAMRELLGPPEPHPASMEYTRTMEDGRTVNAGTILPTACWAQLEEAVVGSELFAMDARAGTVASISASGATREVYQARDRAPITAEIRNDLRAMLASGPRTPLWPLTCGNRRC